MPTIRLSCVTAALLAAAASADFTPERVWFYVQTNLLPEQNIPPLLALMERAKKAGYNGLVIADSKFGRLGELDERYFGHARQVSAKAEALGLELVPCVFPVGYAESLLAHDVNLAEGLPVVDAPFAVRGGRLVPVPDGVTELRNGGFEEAANGHLAGWWQEESALRLDREVAKEGKQSVRMEDIGRLRSPHGNCRVNQVLQTRPFRYYRLSVWIKTENFETPGDIRLQVLAARPQTLTYKNLGVPRTQDWTRHDVVFNSLENTEVRVYCGVWGGRGGRLWWDGLTLEPAGFVNVLRREACPLRLTSPDGKTVYEEGRDTARIEDPKLGRKHWPGSYDVWHEPPEIRLPPGSRLKEGDRVLASYYHPMMIYDDQVTCSLVAPKVFELLDDQMRRVHGLFRAQAYMMSHDEIRVGGWTPDYAGRTMGQALAANVRRCAEIARQHAPKARLCVWADMFDPNHNAVDNYYLCKTTLAGSWEGLPKDVTVVDWHAGIAAKAFAFFGARGHAQLFAGYYDGDPAANAAQWLEGARASGAKVTGAMYTTWQSRYDDLERFRAALEIPAAR